MDIKPNGKLAALLQSPFTNEIKALNLSLRNVNKALNAIGKLEKAAEKQAQADRPSTLDNMKTLKKQLESEKASPKQTRGRGRNPAVEIN